MYLLNINCAQRNNCFEIIRNVKLKNVIIKQLLIKVITSKIGILFVNRFLLMIPQ